MAGGRKRQAWSWKDFRARWPKGPPGPARNLFRRSVAGAFLLAICLLVVGCGASGGTKPHVGATHSIHVERVGLCGSADCRPYAVSLGWDATTSGVAGYSIFENGTRIASTSSSPYLIQSLHCGTTFTFGVEPHDSAGSPGQLITTRYRTPACRTPSGLHAVPAPRRHAAFSPLHVSANHLLNAGNQPVALHGVDRAGTEYKCEQNAGIFDNDGANTPGDNPTNDDLEVQNMATWGVNSEVLGLNEDCWLGINGVNPAYGGQNYINAIAHNVATEEAHGIYPVIALYWEAPGTTLASSQDPMPDNDHAPLFWEEVANEFKNDPYVIFRIREEPYPSDGYNLAAWKCWSQGDVSYSRSSDASLPRGWQSSPGTQTAPTSTGTRDDCTGQVKDEKTTAPYQAVGMQSLLNIIRGTGARNIIQVPGIGYANMMACSPTGSPVSCGFLDSADGVRVTDPDNNMMADVDLYPESNVCGYQGNPSCYEDTYLPVVQVMPFDVGEIGENGGTGTSAITTYVNMALNWLDANAGGNYYAWAWDEWGGLISRYTSATPAQVYGVDYYDHIHGITYPSAPKLPSDGITFVQAAKSDCGVSTPSGHVSLSSAVGAGDDLFVVVAGQGYTTAQPAPTITSVSDNVNGAWRQVVNSGPQTSRLLNLTGAVYELLGSKAAPSGLTLTIHGSGSALSALVLDMRGVASVTASSFQSKLQMTSTPFTGPTLSSVPANDLVLGLWSVFSGNAGESLIQTPTWDTGGRYQAISTNCASAVADWTQPTSAGSVTASANAAWPMPYYGGALDLHP